MDSVLDILSDIFKKGISSAFPDIPDPPIDISLSSNNPTFGDFQCNSALRLANIYKQSGSKLRLKSFK